AHDAHALAYLFRREPDVALELHRSDLVTLAFVHDEPDHQTRRAEIVELHFFAVEIDVTLVPIKILQLLLILLKLVLLEFAAAGQPGKHPVPPRLALPAQFALRE